MTVSKPVPTDLIDGLLESYKKPEDLIGENGLLKQLTKELVERDQIFLYKDILLLTYFNCNLGVTKKI